MPIASAGHADYAAGVSVRVEVAGGYGVALVFGFREDFFPAATAVVLVDVDSGAPLGFLDLDHIVQHVTDYHGLLALGTDENDLMAGGVARGGEGGNLVGDGGLSVDEFHVAELLQGDDIVPNIGRRLQVFRVGEVVPVLLGD